MMLTARAEEIDRVVGFELGADDYVTKPFSIRELLLRVAALLRGRAAASTSRWSPVSAAAHGPRGAPRLGRRPGGRAHRPRAQALIMLLRPQEPGADPRDLAREVWGCPSDITTRTVDTHVKRLREKLGAGGDYIETVRGVGYRFAEEPD
jgi:two-component system phosphate regulon response regulator PhoB